MRFNQRFWRRSELKSNLLFKSKVVLKWFVIPLGSESEKRSFTSEDSL